MVRLPGRLGISTPRARRRQGGPGGAAAVALVPPRVGPLQGESDAPEEAVPGTGVMEVGGASALSRSACGCRRRFHSSGAPVRSRICLAKSSNSHTGAPVELGAGDGCASSRLFHPPGLRGGHGAGLIACCLAAGEAATRGGLPCLAHVCGLFRRPLLGRPGACAVLLSSS